MTPGIPASAIEQIIERVFVHCETSLEDAAQPFDHGDFLATVMRLRASMGATVATLPDAAFHSRGEGSTDEADWSAGQIVSHNTDRMIWAVRRMLALARIERVEVPAALERLAATRPLPLNREESLVALRLARQVLDGLFSVLSDADTGSVADSHLGVMSIRGWLLLLIIHDYDHCNQLADRQEQYRT